MRTRTISLRRLRIPLVLLTAACFGSALAFTAVQGATPRPKLRKDATITFAPRTQNTSLSSLARLGAKGATEEVIKSLDRSVIVSASLDSAPNASTWQGKWFDATVSVPSVKNGAQMRGQWQAELAQGALADVLNTTKQTNTGNVIAGSTIKGLLPNGHSVELFSGASGDVTAGQVFLPPATPAAVKATTSTVLDTFGLKVVSISTWQPLGTALAVVATAADLRTLSGKLDRLTNALQGSPARYDGIYLEIQSTLGDPIVRTATAFRTGAGSLWIKPGLPVRLGTMHG